MIPFVLADHSLISAVPFLVPALIIIGFLAFHVIRDRRSGDGDEQEFYEDDWAGSDRDAGAASGRERDTEPADDATSEPTAGDR